MSAFSTILFKYGDHETSPTTRDQLVDMRTCHMPTGAVEDSIHMGWSLIMPIF